VPTTLISGYADVLLSGEGATLEMRRQALEAILHNTERLRRISDEMSDVLAIETGKLVPAVEPFELRDLLIVLTSSLLPRERERLSVLRGDGAEQAMGDLALTARAVTELLLNALQHDHTGAAVELDMGVRGGVLEVLVRDRGPGIPDGQKQKAFERFTQLEDAMHHDAGMGMGLFIARAMVETQGGSLDLADTPGGGCTATVHIPRLAGVRSSINTP
jgi:signal transduction histidine kinase